MKTVVVADVTSKFGIQILKLYLINFLALMTNLIIFELETSEHKSFRIVKIKRQNTIEIKQVNYVVASLFILNGTKKRV